MVNWGQARSATQITTPAWRDPRVVVGVVFVLVSAAVGARLLAQGDDMTQYWTVSSAVTAGSEIDRDLLTPSSARVAPDAAAHLLAVKDPLPADLDDLVWNHDVEAGALVERSDVRRADDIGTAQVPVVVQDGYVPRTLRPGDTVGVWVGPGPGEDGAAQATQVLDSAEVVSVTRLSGGSSSALVVNPGSARVDAEMIARLAAGHVTIVRVP